MKLLFALGALMMAPATFQAAAPSPYADFDIVSVVPRSPNVKPQLMPIPAREAGKQLAPKGTAGTGR